MRSWQEELFLAVSDNTVDCHIKNAVAKLRTANKTSAAMRAALFN